MSFALYTETEIERRGLVQAVAHIGHGCLPWKPDERE